MAKWPIGIKSKWNIDVDSFNLDNTLIDIDKKNGLFSLDNKFFSLFAFVLIIVPLFACYFLISSRVSLIF